MKKLVTVFLLVTMLMTVLPVGFGITASAANSDPFDMTDPVSNFGYVFTDNCRSAFSAPTKRISGPLQINSQDSIAGSFGDDYKKGYAHGNVFNPGGETSVVYTLNDYDITSFIIRNYTTGGVNENGYESRYSTSHLWVKVFLSKDGKTWQRLTMVDKKNEELFLNSETAGVVSTAGNGWTENIIYNDSIGEGYKYLKVLFPDDYTNADEVQYYCWANQLGSVKITYDVPSEMFTNNNNTQDKLPFTVSNDINLYWDSCDANDLSDIKTGVKGVKLDGTANGDESMYMSHDPNGENYVEYGSRFFNLNGFAVYTYISDYSACPEYMAEIQVSSDGVDFVPIDENSGLKTKVNMFANNARTEVVLYSDGEGLPENTKFIRVYPHKKYSGLLKTDPDNYNWDSHWMCLIGKVYLDINDNNEIPTSPVRNANEKVFVHDFVKGIGKYDGWNAVDWRTFINDASPTEAELKVGGNAFNTRLHYTGVGRLNKETDGYIQYTAPEGRINNLTAYAIGKITGLEFEVSTDGVSYTRLEGTKSVQSPRTPKQIAYGWGNWMTPWIYYNDNIPEGVKKIRVVVPQDASDAAFSRDVLVRFEAGYSDDTAFSVTEKSIALTDAGNAAVTVKLVKNDGYADFVSAIPMLASYSKDGKLADVRILSEINAEAGEASFSGTLKAEKDGKIKILAVKSLGTLQPVGKLVLDETVQ